MHGASTMTIVAAFVLAILTVLVYFPALSGQFLFDDYALLIEGPLIKVSDGLYRIWFTTQAADYWPITNTTFWIEWRLWAESPVGYHLTNLILHIADCLLLWLVLRRIGIPGAFLGALLFALHPVNVESVAWIAQRKNVLAMFFFLLSVLWYFKETERVWYWLSLAAFAAAMLSKGSVAIEPPLLLLVAWWLKGKIQWKDLLRSLPLFVIGGVLTLVDIWFQKHGSGEQFRSATPLQRILGAGTVVWFYLYKALLPIDLSFVYPQWNIDIGELRWWLGLIACIVVTGVLIWQRKTRWGRVLLMVWLFFCISLLPVMGFTDVGYMQYSLVADHYLHISLIALVALIGALLSLWAQRQKTFANVTAIALIVACASLSLTRTRLFGDRIRLYEDTIAKNPDSYMAHNNLGTALVSDDKLPQAIEHLGVQFARTGHLPEAKSELEESIRLNPDYAESHNDYGNILRNMGQLDEAMTQFHEATRLDPAFSQAYANLAVGYAQMRQFTQATAMAKKALALARWHDDEVTAGQIQILLQQYQAQQHEVPSP
jgi:hypothetical protein